MQDGNPAWFFIICTGSIILTLWVWFWFRNARAANTRKEMWNEILAAVIMSPIIGPLLLIACLFASVTVGRMAPIVVTESESALSEDRLVPRSGLEGDSAHSFCFLLVRKTGRIADVQYFSNETRFRNAELESFADGSNLNGSRAVLWDNPICIIRTIVDVGPYAPGYEWANWIVSPSQRFDHYEFYAPKGALKYQDN